MLEQEFPILTRSIRGKRLAYLDNAASTQKPRAVIEAMNDCYENDYSNIHRGVHYLSQQLTARYDDVRAQVARFIHAARPEEIIFTKGTTEGLNLLASSLAEMVLEKGDKVLITEMEHHANIVPWQIACHRFGAELVILPMNDHGELIIDDFSTYLDGVKIFSATWVSNALGTINHLVPLIAEAKSRGIYTIVDGAQAVAHLPTDVQALNCDFFVFSGHKIYGPTGIGVLYGRYELLEKMPPYQSGGDMILSVSFEKTLYAPPPHKFEAGTPPIVEVAGLGAALEWIEKADIAKLATYEDQLRIEAEKALLELDGVRLIGTAAKKAAVISFVLQDIHPHDAGTIFDQYGVAVRVGNHCAEPAIKHFNVPATIRASFAAYNNRADVEALLEAVRATQKLFA